MPTKKSSTYSKGNRQKVALIAAFSCKAELYLFDEPTPKDAMDGSEVWDYFKAGKLREIAMYCEKDVKALRNIFVKMIKQGVYKL